MPSQMNLIRRLYGSVVSNEDRWFQSDVSGSTADILRIYSSSNPAKLGQVQKRDTLVLHLLATEPELWNEISKDTRYEIRRAERDGVQVRTHVENDMGWLFAFSSAYELLRTKKNLPGLRTHQLDTLHARGNLAVSTSIDASGEILSWHIYVVSKKICRLLHSVSRQYPITDSKARANVGRANRFHHWCDILAFKAEGKTEYDLGGIYLGSDDPEKTSIADFKKQFGGRAVIVYDATVALTQRGRIALFLANRWRKFAKRR